MRKYLIYWGTDYCDNFTERTGIEEIEAETEEEAEKKFSDLKIPKAIIYRIEKETESC